METVKKILHCLLHGDYFESVLDHIYGLALAVGVFIVVGYFYIFNPVILLYVLLAGLLFVGWFMMYFLVPEWYEQIQKIKDFIVQLFNKYFRS